MTPHVWRSSAGIWRCVHCGIETYMPSLWRESSCPGLAIVRRLP